MPNRYLTSAPSAPTAQLDYRLENWFSAVQQYPRQLHEMDQATYLEMKPAEPARQQTAH